MSDFWISLAQNDAEKLWTTIFYNGQLRGGEANIPATAANASASVTMSSSSGLQAFLMGAEWGVAELESQGTLESLALRVQVVLLFLTACFYIVLGLLGALFFSLGPPDGSQRPLSLPLLMTLCAPQNQANDSIRGEAALHHTFAMAAGMIEEEIDSFRTEQRVTDSLCNSKIKITEVSGPGGSTVPVLQLQHVPPSSIKGATKHLRKTTSLLHILTSVFGGLFIGFAFYCRQRQITLPFSAQGGNLFLTAFAVVVFTLLTTLITFPAKYVMKESDSEEWTRVAGKVPSTNIPFWSTHLQKIFDDISTNTASIFTRAYYIAFQPARKLISMHYRLTFFTCTVLIAFSPLAPSVIQLQIGPSPNGLSQPTILNSLGEEDSLIFTVFQVDKQLWTTERALIEDHGNANLSRLWDTTFDYVLPASVSESLEDCYIGSVLQIGSRLKTPKTVEDSSYFFFTPRSPLLQALFFVNLNESFHYFTDLATFKHDCEWVAPVLQDFNANITERSFIEIQAGEFKGFTSVPAPSPDMHPLERITDTNGNGVYDGTFGWTIFGGVGSGVDLSRSASSQLSDDWEDWIRNRANTSLADAAAQPSLVSTLVCRLNIKIFGNVSTIFYNGTVTFGKIDESRPLIGNIGIGQVSFNLWYIASSIAKSGVGSFRPFLTIGAINGETALEDVPGTINSTIPRDAKLISRDMVFEESHLALGITRPHLFLELSLATSL
ncbi:hypothetical protein BT69DRAFT_858622 [Atractiella rhizophila]|nr:hypothetical protein BT69DRAFT_858622 [Atractiella rhizophila]